VAVNGLGEPARVANAQNAQENRENNAFRITCRVTPSRVNPLLESLRNIGVKCIEIECSNLVAEARIQPS
jgi:hypothetical protein